MNKFMNVCSAKRFGTIVALSAVILFLILSLTRTYPFKSLESVISDAGNDWSKYARFALEIKNNGLFTPSQITSPNGPYHSPTGFLYNYFLALCMNIFGEKVLPIFVIQHIMLGLSVALVYWAFRDKMSALTGLLFLFTLIAFAFMDVYKNYSTKLLSENLIIFTISLFFYCFVKGFEKDSFALQLMAAFSLGVSVLTRPNIFLYAMLIIPLVAFVYLKKGEKGLAKLAIFTTVLILSSSFLLLRNYVVCKKILFLPEMMSASYVINANNIPPSVDLSKVAYGPLCAKLHLGKDMVSQIEYMRQQPVIFFGYYIKKVIFCLGFLPILDSAYSIRPHWMVMWAGYFTYIFLRIRDRMRLEIWEIAVHLYIICYYASLIMSTTVHNYGFRMLIPVTNFVLIFSFMALDRLMLRKSKNR